VRFLDVLRLTAVDKNFHADYRISDQAGDNPENEIVS
jgi:hypothetical protein